MNIAKLKIASFILAIVAIVGVLAYGITAYANPSQFTTTTQTASATTSPVYMTPGAATTTLVHDTQTSSTANSFVNNMTELLVQFTASSTASQLNINFEYSNGYGANGAVLDCVSTPTACDWYEDNTTNLKGFATTTQNNIMAIIPQFQWKFASSTAGQIFSGSTNNRATRALSINVPTRYVRAVFVCATGGAGCGVWAQFVPAKEVRN